MSEVIVSLTSVSKTFSSGVFNRKRVEAIKGVSLNVRRGDIYGFLGPNGAGKTTTVLCLLGLSRITSGKIVRFKKEIFDRVDFFKRTSYVPEESHFPLYMTGRELLFHWTRLYGNGRVKSREKVVKVLGDVGLTGAADRKIGTYSKGMKQRVGIAGALLSDPELVILDEPARGLDPLARHLVRNILIDLAKSGKTIFMNSHILSEVERICSRAAIINEGRICKEFEMTELEGDGRLEVTFRPGLGGKPNPEDAKRISEGVFSFGLKNTVALAEFVAKIAQEKGEVIAVKRRKVDLEDYFIRVVEEDEQ